MATTENQPVVGFIVNNGFVPDNLHVMLFALHRALPPTINARSGCDFLWHRYFFNL